MAVENDLEKLLEEYEVEIAKVKGKYHVTLIGGPKPNSHEHYVYGCWMPSLDSALSLAYQMNKEQAQHATQASNTDSGQTFPVTRNISKGTVCAQCGSHIKAGESISVDEFGSAIHPFCSKAQQDTDV